MKSLHTFILTLIALAIIVALHDLTGVTLFAIAFLLVFASGTYITKKQIEKGL